MIKALRNLLLLTILYVAIPTRTTAQQVPAQPQKDVVVIDFFARNRVVPMPYMEAIRDQVFAAFDHRRRHIIIDAETSRQLSTTVTGSGLIDPTTAATAQSDFIRSRMQNMLDAGARYVVTGAVVDYKFEHIALKNSSKPGFRSSFFVVLSAYDLKLNRTIPDEQFIIKADAQIAENADKEAIATMGRSLSYYIDRHFRFETIIIELGPSNSKGVIKELYIHSGTEMGVEDGDTFNIYEEVPIGGVLTRQIVGRIRVNSVTDTAVAKCKITKGGDEIIDAFMNGRGMICVSDTKALFY